MASRRMRRLGCRVFGHDWRPDQVSNFMALTVGETCTRCGRWRRHRLLMHNEMERLGWKWSA